MPSRKVEESSGEATRCVSMALGDMSINEQSILRLQGYRDLEKIRPVIKRAAVSAARETEALVAAHVYYRILDVRLYQRETLELENAAVFKNEAFVRFLTDVQQVAVFVLTMGPALDDAVVSSMANDQLLHALFLETAGWLCIEAATKKLSIHLKEQARGKGLRLSPRLGPGYNYKVEGRSVSWPLEQQRTLFELFEQDAIDVKILESCAMIPKISRSGLFGFLGRH